MNAFEYNIIERCEFIPLSAEIASLPFTCGNSERDEDLQDFFHHHALSYAEERREQHVSSDSRSLYTRLMFLDLIHTQILESPPRS